MNVSKYIQRKGKLFIFLIFNILQPCMWKQFTTGIFLVKENNSITGQKCSFDCKTSKHPCFASWMSNKFTPETWDELYINQQVIKCKILFKTLHSGSCPDLFICWNTSKLYQLELLPSSQVLFKGWSFQNTNDCDFSHLP